MSEYFAFIVALLRAVCDFTPFTLLCAVLFVGVCFRLVWGLCVPPASAGGRTDL